MELLQHACNHRFEVLTQKRCFGPIQACLADCLLARKRVSPSRQDVKSDSQGPDLASWANSALQRSNRLGRQVEHPLCALLDVGLLLRLVGDWATTLKLAKRYPQSIASFPRGSRLQEDALRAHIAMHEARLVDGIQRLAKSPGSAAHLLLSELSGPGLPSLEELEDVAVIVKRPNKVDEAIVYNVLSQGHNPRLL